jgi:hypothetical protein
MTKIEVNLSLEYGIMFLHDSIDNPEIPADVGKYPIAHTSTCIAICALNYVDGNARFVIADGEYESKLDEYFKGEISCPSKSLSLSDSNGFHFASVPIDGQFAKISIRMSEERNPDIVECIVENIVTF